MATRIFRHDHGTVISGVSYAFKSYGTAEAESRMHDAPRGVEEYRDVKSGRAVYLARSGEGDEARYYGMGGHHVFVGSA
jgi:hypothetical protein